MHSLFVTHNSRRRLALALLLLLALAAGLLPAPRAGAGDRRLPPFARLNLVGPQAAVPAGAASIYLPLVAKPPAAGGPVIAGFSASPATIAPNSASTLAWAVSGATSLSISPGVGPVAGASVVVRPAARTEYTLTASNAAGSVSAKTIVDVRAGGDSGALWLPYTIAGNQVLPTYGTSVAVDGSGGIHAAYAIYVGTDNGLKPASYAYCPTRCADKANWTRVKLGTEVQDARIVVDPAGRPRMLLFGPKPDPTTPYPRSQYQYAECNGGCTNAANWRLTAVATPIEATATREYNNNRYFAIDRQGRMAFVYTDTTQNSHPGTFYVACASNCASAASWTETTLTADYILDKPTLAFGPGGQPRLAFGLFDDQSQLLYIGYAQCDSGCADPAQWSSVLLSAIHGSTMYSLAVDAAGRPRLGFFSGAYPPQPFEANKLYYLWCDADCASPQASWSVANLGLPFMTGDGVDLALDGQNRPRLAYENAGQGLGYAWCEARCESSAATWRSREVESQAALANDYEVLPIRRCTISTWFNGQRTSLALDAAGNPRIGYDAQHWWYGYEIVNGVPRDCNYNDVTVTRFALLDQP
jgi:hypothetical protein